MKKVLGQVIVASLALGAVSTTANAACSCPSGYQVVVGAQVGRAAAKVCAKTYWDELKRPASCDIGWTLDIDSRGDKDLCASVWGQIGEYTIPSGTTGIGGDPRRFGWRLDDRPYRDSWTKSVRKTSIQACAG